MPSRTRITMARELRKRQTPAEALLWQQLRAGRLEGLRFRRQHPIGRYFADFACVPLRLVIELDGRIHGEDEQALHDYHRQAEIEASGWSVLRFPNEQVFGTLPTVVAAIREQARLAGASMTSGESPFRRRSVPCARPPAFKP